MLPNEIKTGNRVKATEQFLKTCESGPAAYQGLGLVLKKNGPECYVQFDSDIDKHWMHCSDLEVIPDDKTRIPLQLGAYAPPLRQQLPAHVPDDVVAGLQGDSDAISRLSIKSMITPTASKQARDRLVRAIQKAIDDADEKLLKNKEA